MRTSCAAWDGIIVDAASIASKSREADRIGEPIKTPPLPNKTVPMHSS
jgi:hypothetical protein